MTQAEVEEFSKSYKEQYGWTLFSRSGNGNHTDDTYLYNFIDDIGICITINPTNKGFSFRKIVDGVFELRSNEFTPLDYPDHFYKNYIRFRKIVIQKELK